MNILKDAIVSNSEMIKNYKTSREKAENFGKIFIFKNNQPDAVLLSIHEYEKISKMIEYLDGLDDKDLKNIIESIRESND
ncbi:MAG: type II toxin-antitoxin system prevent-host-death family antitoxin [Clostridia bacterium]|nr:type II toxin-antitoxin system prevent-host-death family antitoxin [Clostridia bacterium]MDW7662974.1 type II toxin-antitoxin system prevent-host-death family antitoxin [Bacillota bacterium]